MSHDDVAKDFDSRFDRIFEEKSPDYDGHVNVAIVGKVSTGKSSIINAILGRTREDPLASVGAHSGVTTKVSAYRLDEHVLIVDCPGLDDVRKENSEETKRFLASIDLGIFVVTGSADATQKANFDDLRKHCSQVLVVLNKVDEWDDLEESAFEDVVSQWKRVLGVDRLYPACTKGYDPKMRKSAPMDLRGIDDLKEAIFGFLHEKAKDLLLARHLRSKDKYAIRIIAVAIVSVSAEAFIPGSAVYITATQVVAIGSLHYLYKGVVLPKANALAMLPTFAGQALGRSAFLWAKSFLPPTFVLDVAAAGIAAVITFAMLAAVKWMLENDVSLSNSEQLKAAFNRYSESSEGLKNMSLSDFKSISSVMGMVERLLSK